MHTAVSVALLLATIFTYLLVLSKAQNETKMPNLIDFDEDTLGTAETCSAPNPWYIPLNKMKLLYKAKNHDDEGSNQIMLSEKPKQFGLALFTSHFSELVGFGGFATNMSFVLHVENDAACSDMRFIVDFGATTKCLSNPTAGFESILPLEESTDLTLDVPSFKEPIPWPSPSMNLEFDESDLLETAVHIPNCDGVSLALISDPEASGIFVAKSNTAFYAGNPDSIENYQNLIVNMEYIPTSNGHTLTFYVNGKAATKPITYSSKEGSLSKNIAPRITLAAATGSCAVRHKISDIAISHSKAISCEELEEALELDDDDWMNEDDISKTDFLSHNLPIHGATLTPQTFSTHWLAISALFLGMAALLFQFALRPPMPRNSADYSELL